MTTVKLKSMTCSKRRTEETPCYSAVLEVDGQFACFLENDGKGGADREGAACIRVGEYAKPNWALVKQAQLWASQLPPVTTQDGIVLAMNLEMWCHDQAFTKMGM